MQFSKVNLLHQSDLKSDHSLPSYGCFDFFDFGWSIFDYFENHTSRNRGIISKVRPSPLNSIFHTLFKSAFIWMGPVGPLALPSKNRNSIQKKEHIRVFFQYLGNHLVFLKTVFCRTWGTCWCMFS